MLLQLSLLLLLLSLLSLPSSFWSDCCLASARDGTDGAMRAAVMLLLLETLLFATQGACEVQTNCAASGFTRHSMQHHQGKRVAAGCRGGNGQPAFVALKLG